MLNKHILFQEVEEHNVHIIYSKECDTQKMSWSEWSKFVFSKCTENFTSLDRKSYFIWAVLKWKFIETMLKNTAQMPNKLKSIAS